MLVRSIPSSCASFYSIQINLLGGGAGELGGLEGLEGASGGGGVWRMIAIRGHPRQSTLNRYCTIHANLNITSHQGLFIREMVSLRGVYERGKQSPNRKNPLIFDV